MNLHDKIFVYGTLKSECHANWRIANHAEFIDNDRIEGSLYHLGAFPGYKTEGSGMVSGEVYEITDDRLLGLLDEYENYPTLYDRIKMRTEKGYFCWVYVLRQKVQEHCLIEEGVW